MLAFEASLELVLILFRVNEEMGSGKDIVKRDRGEHNPENNHAMYLECVADV